MWRSNPTWSSPRIVAELHKLGIEVAKSTVERFKPQGKRLPSATWRTFLDLQLKDLVAIDFFVVPTATFEVLFVFIVLAHDRRKIVHFNVTKNPTAQWTVQQVVEAFPFDTTPKYLLRDGDCCYGRQVQRRIRSLGMKEVITAPAMHLTIGLFVPPNRRRSSTSQLFTASITTAYPRLHEFSGPTG